MKKLILCENFLLIFTDRQEENKITQVDWEKNL